MVIGVTLTHNSWGVTLTRNLKVSTMYMLSTCSRSTYAFSDHMGSDRSKFRRSVMLLLFSGSSFALPPGSLVKSLQISPTSSPLPHLYLYYSIYPNGSLILLRDCSHSLPLCRFHRCLGGYSSLQVMRAIYIVIRHLFNMSVLFFCWLDSLSGANSW